MWMSIAGMYEYDPSIFDGLDIPSYIDEENVTHVINKDAVINNICLKCAELEIVYPSFDTMKLAIAVWSEANQETWRKLIETQFIKFNPIWNVDANVEINRGIDERNDRELNSSGNSLNAVKGFNSDAWAESEKNDIRNTAAEGSVNNTKENVKERRTGNIGVTASQDLIQKQRSIAEFNIIDYIADSFKKRFCLMVY